MARREFSTKTRKEALKRSGKRCEAVGSWYGLPEGQRCTEDLSLGVQYDHLILDANSKDNRPGELPRGLSEVPCVEDCQSGYSDRRQDRRSVLHGHENQGQGEDSFPAQGPEAHDEDFPAPAPDVCTRRALAAPTWRDRCRLAPTRPRLR